MTIRDVRLLSAPKDVSAKLAELDAEASTSLSAADMASYQAYKEHLTVTGAQPEWFIDSLQGFILDARDCVNPDETA